MKDEIKKTMNTRITILQPKYSGQNHYINIIDNIIENMGYQTIEAKESLKKNYRNVRINIANLNWYENLPQGNIWEKCKRVVLKLAFIIYLKKIRKCKIVVTIHNRYTHNYKDKRFSQILLKNLCIQSDKIVILCEETKNYLRELFPKEKAELIIKKCFLIPHPNYIGCYPINDVKKCEGFNIPQDSCLNILFFGAIKPYKNIELCIELAKKIDKKRIRIILAGGGEPCYIETLRKQIGKQENILFYPQFIPDTQIWGLIEKCDCVLLPYHLESVLNSGACILALSVGKNVISPMFGTIKEFPQDLLYTYQYEKEEEHLWAVVEKVNQVVEEYENNRELFYKKQTALKKIIEKENSRYIVAKRYQKLYKDLENK